jgi:hypothetical protein
MREKNFHGGEKQMLFEMNPRIQSVLNLGDYFEYQKFYKNNRNLLNFKKRVTTI